MRGTHTQIDLDGAWSFAYSQEPPTMEWPTIADVERSGLEIHPCTVPGNLELDLQAIGVLEDPFYGLNMVAVREYERAHVWYMRRFGVSQPPGTIGELVFEGLDCYADIYLNGQLIGHGDNMLVEQVLDVEGLLREDNELLVHIRPAVDEARQHDYPPNLQALKSNYDSLYVRKAPHMYGWDIMPRALSAGIWRPVTLHFRPVEHLAQVYLETLRLSGGYEQAYLQLHVDSTIALSPGDIYDLVLQARCGASVIETRHRMLFQAGTYDLRVSSPWLWWPQGRGMANLYACEVALLKNGCEIDRQAFRHGIRTVSLERTSTTGADGEGEFLFRINGEKVFVRGSNWVPVDAFHSRDVERIPQIVAMAEDLNCNMLRCWGGNVYENDLFYDLCDEKGIMVWQDFAMACAVYPQDADFGQRMAREARQVVRRLRQHPCVVLWAGDNECDMAYGWGGRARDPNSNVLTRQVIPRVLEDEDRSRPYLPSSPYVDADAFKAGAQFLPENHLWGPRDYYKSAFYTGSLCHFASEIGYHGCPAPESIRRFISPDKVWPYEDNEEWLLHATSPIPGVDLYDYRIALMAKQVRELFGRVPDTLEEFSFASQASQAEALKFFLELFRGSKWRRTGILWWNLIDGWPQFSDAVVDYYFRKKLAYTFIRRVQTPLCLMLKEPENWAQVLVACNGTRQNLPIDYVVRDIDTGEVLAQGQGVARADSAVPCGEIPFSMGAKRFYLIEWRSPLGKGTNHYLAGNPPFDLAQYRGWLEKAGILTEDWIA